MNMRSMLWHDWLYLYRNCRQLTCLDNILCLTHGKPLTITHLLFAIHPTDHLYTGVYQPSDGEGKSIAQVYQSPRMNSAHLNFLLQPEGAKAETMVVLLEDMIKHAGGWGAKQVVADVSTDSPFFPEFRQAGFSVLAKQTVFRCQFPDQASTRTANHWRIWSSDDIPAMRCLYHTLVPPLVQPVEPLTRREMLGLVCYDERGELQAYADLVAGPVGVWVLPIIHPQAKLDIAEMLAGMLLALPERNRRAVYVTSRSYQPWVEHALYDLSAEAFPEQALLVRYMALRQRVKAEFPRAAVENGNREPTLPLAPIKNYRE